MPHVIVEYSANLEDAVDLAALCDGLRRAAIETGLFPMTGIRVRALRCATYAIADGDPRNGFIDIAVRLRGGRDLAARKAAAAQIFAAAEQHLAALFEQRPFALSLEMRDIDPELSPKRSSIAEHLARR
jgi:5-carboxymethyl-2-hydroxymuconate isomerase